VKPTAMTIVLLSMGCVRAVASDARTFVAMASLNSCPLLERKAFLLIRSKSLAYVRSWLKANESREDKNDATRRLRMCYSAWLKV